MGVWACVHYSVCGHFTGLYSFLLSGYFIKATELKLIYVLKKQCNRRVVVRRTIPFWCLWGDDSRTHSLSGGSQLQHALELPRGW